MADHKSVLDPVIKTVFDADQEYLSIGSGAGRELPDYVFATPADEHTPDKVFPNIRWGGQFVFASPSLQQVNDLAGKFEEYGFTLDRRAGTVADGWHFWPFKRKKVHFFSARKVLHVPKGALTDRFTFEVELSVSRERSAGQYVVTKRIPSVDWVLNRIAKRNPDIPAEELERRAHVLIRNILPIFLTREVGMMQRLQERMPESMRNRVPHTVRFECDDRGFVNLLQVNWLRNGGRPLSQLEFAMQSAELLRHVHDAAGIAHLDLRLDNMVITPEGVGFIDFGNSVHDDEDIAGSPTLSKVFADLMRSTQVHKAMNKAIKAGHVTAPYFVDALFKPHKAVDLFYLVLQFTSPHDNPDLRDLIEFSPDSNENYELGRMTNRLFAPEDLEPGKVYTAAHVVNAIKKIKSRLD